MPRPRRLLGTTVSLVALLAAVLGVGLLAVPGRVAEGAISAGSVPGTVARPVGRVHLEAFENFTILQVVDANNRIVRRIPFAGNPEVPKPDLCYTQGGYRVSWDYTLVWRLNYFVRLCPGRGIGTHDIPINRYTGQRSMSVSALGQRPGVGSPISHGCLRMLEADAKYLYDHFATGVAVYFVKTPWRAVRPLPPLPPRVVVATPADRRATVSWVPSVVRDSAVTSYIVTVRPGGRTITVAPTVRALSVTGLTNGVAYTFAVTATSAAGWAPASGWSAPVTPLGPPDAPEGLTAVPQGPDAVQVSWLPATTSGAAVAGYLVTVGPTTVTVPATATQATVTGLPTDVPLPVSVAASSAVGRGPAAVTELPRLDGSVGP